MAEWKRTCNGIKGSNSVSYKYKTSGIQTGDGSVSGAISSLVGGVTISNPVVDVIVEVVTGGVTKVISDQIKGECNSIGDSFLQGSFSAGFGKAMGSLVKFSNKKKFNSLGRMQKRKF